MSEIDELKLKRKVQLIVISAISLFFVLCTVAVFQFAMIINRNAQIRTLDRQNAALQLQIDRALDDAQYFDSDQFVYDFALRHLNRGRPNDRVFL